MTTDDFLVQLAKAMAGWIDLDPSSILFADDRDIKYDPPRKSTLNRATLFAPADHLRLREYTEGTHSWVHANLLTTIDGVQVISLRHSAPRRVGPCPSEFAFGRQRPLTLQMAANDSQHHKIGQAWLLVVG